MHQLTSQLQFARMGFSLALGALPKPLLIGRLDHVMQHLTGSLNNRKESEALFVECRRDAIRAMSR